MKYRGFYIKRVRHRGYTVRRMPRSVVVNYRTARKLIDAWIAERRDV